LWGNIFLEKRKTITMILLTNAHVHTGETIKQNHHILIKNGTIQAVLPQKPEGFEGEIEDLEGQHISAGFIDLHINGGEKLYFTQTVTEEALADIEDASRAFGTTHTMPCLITSPLENILRGIKVMRDFMQKHPQSGVLGMHLEGPFLNPIRRGAHLKEYLQTPTDYALDTIINEGKDVIKIMTIAPELFTNNQIDKLLASGIHIAVGHSDATYAQATSAFKQGVKLCTHLFNAMSQMQHRAAGVVGAVLDTEGVYAPIILDGIHCSYEAARIAYKIKKDKLVIISDALFVGRKKLEFEWGDFNATLKNGEYRNSEGNLAGAAIAMSDAVHNAVFEVGISLEEAVKMATVRPAKAIDMDGKIGRIRKGFAANFVVFKEKMDNFKALSY
jgi:N-acetylglucosamine-6-phosphate deacetylase